MLIFCTAGLVIAAAKMCITDAMLTFFVVTPSQTCLGIMYASGLKRIPRVQKHRGGRCRDRADESAPAASPRPRYQLAPLWVATAFWISLALAGLTKGPQALGFHAVTLLVLLGLDVGRSFRFEAECGRGDAIRWWREFRPSIGIPMLVILTAP